MNSTTKILILCIVLVGAFIGIQQLQQPETVAPAHDENCAEPGGG